MARQRRDKAIVTEQVRQSPMREGLRIYNLFPTLAGSIAGWTAQLPWIAAMGFNAVYLNPFHYPGFSGSLYAVKDYYRLNPRFRPHPNPPPQAGEGRVGARRGKVEISRFKGLGEMPARYLKATTMDPAHRTLLRVKLPEPADPAAIETADEGRARTEGLVETLMGRRPELRFDYIQKNARFARDLDV